MAEAGIQGSWPRPARPEFRDILWALMALPFEVHTPFKMFREPLALVVIELAFWAIVLGAEGLVLCFIYGKSREAMER
ncbi:hypothetical protein ACEWPM_008705 [Roseovarius sp. S4756]|uniref:hypothetical protein n=1 Tax=Roseovarius maritimus TaxID=3342637 RepID=UPI00372C3F1F